MTSVNPCSNHGDVVVGSTNLQINLPSHLLRRGPVAFEHSFDLYQQSNNNSSRSNDKIDSNEETVVPTWRLKERMKTVGVGLILALNIGTDPPDIDKPDPCAKLQCWIDPTSISRAKARERIGERLEAQYARWQQRAKLKYKRALDPTVDDVRSLCVTMRRNARNERLLLHYNGHGVPRPTANGEIWVFDKNHTQYIPLSVTELRRCIGKPSLVVLDCSGAGVLLPFLTRTLESTPLVGPGGVLPLGGIDSGGMAGTFRMPHAGMGAIGAGPDTEPTDDDSHLSNAARSVRDIIVLCPTSANDLLPLNPKFPADLFTSCLTTPIPVALRWFVHRNPLSFSTLDPESVELIPGKVNDRKTPLGELNWIFTAVTDTIAWNVLPSQLFQQLFRQDLLVASMFRNFLLADRILRGFDCTPLSYPVLPNTSDHPLWQAWDLAVETCLSQLVRDGVIGTASALHVTSLSAGEKDDDDDDTDEANGDSNIHAPGGGTESTLQSQQLQPGQNLQNQQQLQQQTGYAPILTGGSIVTAPFFSEQLTAFEIWLEYAATRVQEGGIILNPPRKQYETASYLSSGNSASTTHSRMSLDMESPEQLPVVLQVLLSQAHRVRALILLRRFLDLGPSAVNLALSVGIFPYVLKLLQSPIDEYKHVLVGIWAKVLEFDLSCQVDLVKDGALPHFIRHLHWGISDWSGKKHNGGNGMEVGSWDDAAEQRTMAAVILSAICLGYPLGQTECLKKNLYGVCSSLLQSIEFVDDHENNDSETLSEAAKKRALAEKRVTPQFRLWLCICIGNSAKDHSTAQIEAYKSNLHIRLIDRLRDSSADVRAGACYALSCLLGTALPAQAERSDVASSGVRPNPSTAPAMTQASPDVVSFGAARSNMKYNPSLIPVHVDMPLQGLMLPASQQQQQHLMLPRQQLQPQALYGAAGPNDISSVGGVPNADGGSMYAQLAHQQHPQRPPQPSIYEDRRRLDFDSMTANNLVLATEDASPTVRYEATLALACSVGKYLPAYAAIADGASFEASNGTERKRVCTSNSEAERADQSSSEDQKPTSIDSLEFPPGVDRETANTFGVVWKALRALQHTDPHPAVCVAATSVVSVVHEHLLLFKTRLAMCRDEKRRIFHNFPSNSDGGRPHSSPGGAVADYTESHGCYSTSLNAVTNIGNPPMNTTQPRQPETSRQVGATPHLGHWMGSEPVYGRRQSAEGNSLNTLGDSGRRNLSDHVMNIGFNNNEQREAYSSANSIENGNKMHSVTEDQYKIEYFLPKSKFYIWKRSEFADQEKITSYAHRYGEMLDPLSPGGATQAYRERRNVEVHKRRVALNTEFSILGTRHPQSNESLSSTEGNGDISIFGDMDVDLLGDLDDNGTADAAAALERDIAVKKRALHLNQSAMLVNEDTKMTSIVRFHAYEPTLVVCDGSDGISVWDTRNSRRVNDFSNGNPEGTRMTSVKWINEMSRSLLLSGCNDGSVRIWDGIIEVNGNMSVDSPQLSSAFFAVPGLVAGLKGSGLVTDWQQFSGQLLAGGNTNTIRCWDLQAEKCRNYLESEIDSCLTTLTTAWDHTTFGDANESNITEGYSGIGPDIVVGGYGDGTIKVFDIRSSHRGSVSRTTCDENKRVLPNGMTSCRSRRNRLMQYNEHSHWIVDMSFTGYGGRYEIVSGCVAGDIKFWDLRMPSSVRTVSIQRSPMTALACHPRIPFLATGSHAQFIKLFTPDGDTLQVIRYHEKTDGQRIGPVSFLTFHPNKPLLAAGATDEIISLYSPSK